MAKILVTGSTGNVGSHVVRELLSRGQSVPAVVPTGGHFLFDSRVEVVEGDFSDTVSLRKAVSGVSRMYLVSNGPDIQEHETNAVEVAKAASLELLVKQSVAGAQ
ncbi:MAG: NAD(P)H-binding protein [Acidobacteriaceae bacterium]|nr:NAD(P)H-binding protein [Acidobacteriaceae bacterium]